MRDEKEERKKQARSNKQTRQSNSTPKAVTFPRKNELPQVGLEPTTLYTLDRALYMHTSFVTGIVRSCVCCGFSMPNVG